MARIASGHAVASPGTSSTLRTRPREFCTATWPSTGSPSTSALSTTGSVVADLREPHDDEVPERVTVELPADEAVLERLLPHGVVTGERDEALAQVARCRDAEIASQPARRASVVGDADDRGDRPRVPADR